MQKTSYYLSKLLSFCRRHFVLLASAAGLLIVLLVLPIVFTFTTTRGHRYDLSRTPISSIPYSKVGIVFGAGIYKNGTPTPYLSYRIQTAATLYKNHKVSILLMSGDNSTFGHNEPNVMRDYAIKLGVPAKAIVEDYAGFNTYDSCFRAHTIFGLKDATLISQGYHLPRAMATCRGLGIQNVGVIAIHPARDYTINYLLREVLSTDKMVFQLIFKPNPTVLGEPVAI